MRPAVDRAVEALAWRARERGVRIVVRVPETLPAALGDAEEIALAVQNLIDNAIKYGAADSTVTVEAKADAEAVAVAGERRRAGDRRRTPPPPHGTFLSGGQGALEPRRRHGSGAGYRQACRAAAPRRARHRQRARRGQPLRHPPAPRRRHGAGRGRGPATRNRSFPVTANLRARHRRRTGHGRPFAGPCRFHENHEKETSR